VIIELGKLKKPSILENEHLSKIVNKELDIDFQELESMTNKIIEDFKNIGLDYIWNGSIHRLDDLISASLMIDGLDYGEVIRCGSDRYSLLVYALKEPTLKRNIYLEEVLWLKRFGIRLKVPMLGAYTFTSMLSLDKLVKTRKRILPITRLAYLSVKREYSLMLGEILNDVIKSLVKDDIEFIQLNEWLGLNFNGEDNIFLESLRRTVKNFEDKIILYMGEITVDDAIKIFKKTGIERIVIPITHLTTSELVEVLKKIGNYSLRPVFGIIDAFEEKIEDQEYLRERIGLIRRYIKTEDVLLSPDAPMDFIEYKIAIKKLSNLKMISTEL